MITDAEIGARVRALRKARSLRQQDVADRMTVTGHKLHHTYVCKIESGDRPLLAREAAAMAPIFGVTVAGLLGDEVAQVNDALAELWQRVQQLEAIRERYDKIRRITGQESE